MMNEEFAKRIYETLVCEVLNSYRKLYEKEEITEHTIDYWKNAIELHRNLNNNEKKIFYDILKQTIIDTVSGVLGILDGSSSLSGREMEISININGCNSEGELQDAFLELVEKDCVAYDLTYYLNDTNFNENT